MQRRIGVRDLRLVPPAVVAWIGAGFAIGFGDDGQLLLALSIGCWAAVIVGALCAVLIQRCRWLPTVVVGLVALALAVTAVTVASERREPDAVRTAIDNGRSVHLTLAITGRTIDGRIAATIVAVAEDTGLSSPALLFGAPDDPVIADGRIGEVIAVTGGLQRADPADDIAVLVYARDEAVRVVEPPPLLASAATVRADFSAIAANLPGAGGDLLPGLAIGDTSSVSTKLDADMKASSLSHLTAVSGSNCAIVVGLVFAVAAVLGMPRWSRVTLSASALAGFVILVTPEPSVVRAATMAAIALFALASSRPGRGIPLLCIAVIGLLVSDPWLARSYGFALSVLATAGLLTLAAPIAFTLRRWLPSWLALVIAVPFAAQIACQPVLLLLEPTLPVYGVIANVLAEPAAPFATILGLLACMLAPVAPPLALVVAWLAWIPASWIAAVATFTAALPGARSPWPTGAIGIALLILITVAGIVVIARTAPERARSIARSVLVVAFAGYLATLAGTRIVTEFTRPGNWQFALCDVGQGDALLLRSSGAVALVDTGAKPDLLASCLDGLGIGRIHLLVLTHFDLDHVGGVDAVIGRVDRVVVGPASDPADEGIITALERGGAIVDSVSRGHRGILGELGWTVIWPPPRGIDPGNDASVVLEVRPAPTCVDACLSAVLLGDLGEVAQNRMLASAHPGATDVVKVAHHGSADQSLRLYEALRATVGLIGVGADNDYGHPTDAVLDMLSSAGTVEYRSDRDGLVLVAPDSAARSVRIWTERSDPADSVRATEGSPWRHPHDAARIRRRQRSRSCRGIRSAPPLSCSSRVLRPSSPIGQSDCCETS